MTAALVIFIAILSVASAVLSGLVIYSRRVYGLTFRELLGLSWPSQQIMRGYHSLPRENRPKADMYSMLAALDKSCGGSKAVSAGFLGYSTYDWRNISRWGEFGRYVDIYESIQGIREALEEQERQFMLAGISADLDRVQDVIDFARTEREMIDEVTTAVVTPALDGRSSAC